MEPFDPAPLLAQLNVPDSWKQAVNMAGAWGRPPKALPDVPRDGIDIDLIDVTDRTYPGQPTDYNAVKANRIAALHDSALVAEMPKATRQYLHEHGKSGICCERPECGRVQCAGEKVSLKRCGRVSALCCSLKSPRLTDRLLQCLQVCYCSQQVRSPMPMSCSMTDTCINL